MVVLCACERCMLFSCFWYRLGAPIGPKRFFRNPGHTANAPGRLFTSPKSWGPRGNLQTRISYGTHPLVVHHSYLLIIAVSNLWCDTYNTETLIFLRNRRNDDELCFTLVESKILSTLFLYSHYYTSVWYLDTQGTNSSTAVALKYSRATKVYQGIPCSFILL